MKIESVAIGPNEGQLKKRSKIMCPELLASVGARYSRSNLGLNEIYNMVDQGDTEKSIDDIFKYVDFKHNSIADMAPIPIFIDGISLWLAYCIFAQCPTAAGQESSTRYIDFSKGNAENILIDKKYLPRDLSFYEELLSSYRECCDFWKRHGEKYNSFDYLEGKTELYKNRIKRNYVFDRARYLLPVACKTNVMLLQSSRDWVSLVKYLLSAPYPEFVDLGNLIKKELEIVSPRMVKHAVYSSNQAKLFDIDFKEGNNQENITWSNYVDGSYLDFYYSPLNKKFEDCIQGLENRENRYDKFSQKTRDCAARFGWKSIAFAELRDLNRHRTGEKVFMHGPTSYYMAEDQLLNHDFNKLEKINEPGLRATQLAAEDYNYYKQDYIYSCPLGAEFGFSHLTTLNHVIYEIELRTSSGCHFNYKRHMEEIKDRLIKLVPDLEDKFIIS